MSGESTAATPGFRTSSPVAPTLRDVALKAGVSMATASRVLNGSTRRVAESYRARVQEAADLLGYTPNLSAQATARGSAAIAALLVADISDPYFGLIAAGVARGAEDAGLILTTAITQRDPIREVRVLRALRGQRPRAVILAASRATHPGADLAREIEAIAAVGGTVVALGAGVKNVRSVIVDNVGGARGLALHLTRLGYTKAVILGAQQGVRTSDERIRGFVEGFTTTGGTIDHVYRGEFTRESGAEMARNALRTGVLPGTVVFCVSDVIAIGAHSTLRSAGRIIGADVAVAGFDDIPSSHDVSPSLTTVRVPLEEVGYQAFRAAVDDSWTLPSDALKLTIVLRESTPPRHVHAP